MQRSTCGRSLYMEPEKKSIEEQNRELAMAYAKYLRDHNLHPGDATFLEPDSLGEDLEKQVSDQLSTEPVAPAPVTPAPKAAPVSVPKIKEFVKQDSIEETVNQTAADKKRERTKRKREERRRKRIVKGTKELKPQTSKMVSIENVAAAPLDALDRALEKIDSKKDRLSESISAGAGKIATGYRASKKTIGRAILAVCVLCGIMLVVFDKFTVYEYAYNGKVLGYVENQDDVTNVLQVASEQLSEVNEENGQDIEFEANDNISFKLVRSAGQDTDDVDTTVNKLAYMTDIEVEAFGVYDNGRLATIVKSEDDANTLLAQVKAELGTPDQGMEVVSIEFNNNIEIRPINILLTSVQSNMIARSQMTKGGETKFYHLVEDGETLSSVASDFGVNTSDIYNETNKKVVNGVEAGDKVCVRKTVSPVSVKLVETGKMRESIPYETIEKKSKDYYIGDKVVSVKGKDGVQIFDGTLTKVAGKVINRETNSIEVIKDKVDEVILVGTTERPRTAPTGTFHNPMAPGTYIVTSRPGWRWGAMHKGVDMGASTGTPVYASDGGTVVRAGWFSGYGNCIDIEHANGWMTRYGHLSSIDVRLGEKVYQGQYIGAVGSTGRSTGPHLHFETRLNDVFVDPDTKVVGGL